MGQNHIYDTIVSRNLGIISSHGQAELQRSVVAIAGCGADGGEPAVSLARLGILNFRLADPDIFDLSNLNRQEGANHKTLGQNKSEVIASIIKDIQPNSQVKTYPTGITQENVDEFLKGTDILLEEVDYRNPKIALMLHRKAREYKIPVFSVISVAWNSFLFYFTPDSLPFEDYFGITTVESDLIESKHLNIEAFVPENLNYIPIKLINEIVEGKKDIPVVDSTVRCATGLITSHVVFFLTKTKKIKPVPYYYSLGDLFLKKPRKNLKLNLDIS